MPQDGGVQSFVVEVPPAISKKMTTDDLNLFVSIGRRYQEFLTKSGALKSQYDDTLTAVKQRLKEESERPAERSLINASDYDELEDMIAREARRPLTILDGKIYEGILESFLDIKSIEEGTL